MRASGHAWGPKGRNSDGAPTCQIGRLGRLLCGRRCVSTATSAATYLRLLFQVGFVNAAFDRGDRFRCGRFCHLGIVRKSVHAPTRAARYDKRPLLDELAEIDARSRRAESNPLCNLCPSHRRCGCRETVDDGSLCHRRFCIASRLVFASRFRVSFSRIAAGSGKALELVDASGPAATYSTCDPGRWNTTVVSSLYWRYSTFTPAASHASLMRRTPLPNASMYPPRNRAWARLGLRLPEAFWLPSR